MALQGNKSGQTVVCGNTRLELRKFQNKENISPRENKRKGKRCRKSGDLYIFSTCPEQLEWKYFSDFSPLNKNAFILVNALSGHRYHRSAAARTSIYYFTMR